MTLGQKLAGYRKLAGLTQQQLGEHLNISAQAISKWEKDLSEPALATLRALAELYKVSVDELLDLNAGFADVSAPADNEEEDTEKEPPRAEAQSSIGFCKNCGIAVTEENLGTTQPTVLCKSCLQQQQEAEKKAAEAERRKREEAIRANMLRQENNRRKRRNHRTLSLVIATISAVAFLILMIAVMINGFSTVQIPITVVGLYAVFAFVSCLFYDCFVQEVVLDWFDKSLHLPGLIFTFDLDGVIWLIGMKLLFCLLGILFGIVTGIVGVIVGLFCAPFVFPFVMHKESRGIANGEAPED